MGDDVKLFLGRKIDFIFIKNKKQKLKLSYSMKSIF